jgi:signal transduction histidine kinase
MLDISRLDTGAVRLQREPVPLNEIVEEVASSFGGLAQDRGLSIRVERLEIPIMVKADRDGLRRILVNLVDNAIKFNTPGGRVLLSTRDEGDEAVVCVEDTGVGIDPADHQRVFEEYVQLGTVRHRGGSGLGLAIVKGIVEAHHGRVWVDSRTGEGSRFYFSLPKNR